MIVIGDMLVALLIFGAGRIELKPENNFQARDLDGGLVSLKCVRLFKSGGWNEYVWDGARLSLKERIEENNYRQEFSRYAEGDGSVEFKLEEPVVSDAPVYSLHDRVVFGGNPVTVRIFKVTSETKRDFSIVYSRQNWKHVGVIWADGRKGGRAIGWKGVRLAEAKSYWSGTDFVIDWAQVMDGPGEYAELQYLYDGLDRSMTDRQVYFVWNDGKRLRAREFWMERNPEVLAFVEPTVVAYRVTRSLAGLERVEIQERPVQVAFITGLKLP